METFKDILGYEGIYKISDKGRVKSLKRIIAWNGTYKEIKERILKPGINPKGYLGVCLINDKSERKTKQIHRIVAKTFINNPKNKREVNHKDGVKINNNKSNLEWVTSSENQKHSYRTGTRKPLPIEQLATFNAKPILQLDINNNVINYFKSAREATRETGVFF